MRKSQPGELTDRYSLAILILWTLLMRNVMLTQKCYDPDDPMHDDELGYGQFACFSEHPNDRRNWIARIGSPLFRNGLLSYHSLTPKLQELTTRTLIQGLHEPSKRPQALEWERALAEAYDLLVSCFGCRQSFLYQYWLSNRARSFDYTEARHAIQLWPRQALSSYHRIACLPLLLSRNKAIRNISV